MNQNIQDLIKLCDSQAAVFKTVHKQGDKLKAGLFHIEELKSFLNQMAQPVAHAPGDVVLYKPTPRVPEDEDETDIGLGTPRSSYIGHSMIIMESHLQPDGTVSYVTSHGAWFEHQDLEFVRKCSQEEWAKLAAILAAEDDVDDDDDEDVSRHNDGKEPGDEDYLL